MKNILPRKLFPFRHIHVGRFTASKSRGQSLVEIAIAFPVLIMMLAGLVEFGFMLNYYLSLLDSTREAARTFSNFTPFEDGYTLSPRDCTCSVASCPNEEAGDRVDADCDKNTFYQGTAGMVLDNLQPRSAMDTSRRIILNSASDDVVVSVFSVASSSVTRFPAGGEYRWFNNQPSRLSNAEIADRLIANAPDTGILLVEVFFDYHQVLALPWLAPFLPDPVLLHAYTMMPLAAAEPGP
jgi:hypothetical protein